MALPTAAKKLCPHCKASYPEDYLYCPDDGAALAAAPTNPVRRLSEILKEEGVLRPADACRLGASIAGVLAEMHSRGLGCSDLGPWNVQVEELPGGPAIHILGVDRPAADARGDVGSLGALVHWMALGRGPFAPPLAPDASSLLYRAGGSVESKRPASFSPALGDMLDRLTDPDPARRPGSAREAGEALAAVARDLAPRPFRWEPGDFVGPRYRLGSKVGEDEVTARFAAADFHAFADVELVIPQKPELADRLYREGHRWLPVRHPALEEVLDVGEAADGTPFLAVLPLGGQALGRLLEPSRLSWPDAGPILRAVARCLATVHAAGLQYGDLGPDRVRVGTGRHPAAVTAPWRPALVGRNDGNLGGFGKLISVMLAVQTWAPRLLGQLAARLAGWQPEQRPSWDEVLATLDGIEWAPPAPPDRQVIPGS